MRRPALDLSGAGSDNATRETDDTHGTRVRPGPGQARRLLWGPSREGSCHRRTQSTAGRNRGSTRPWRTPTGRRPRISKRRRTPIGTWTAGTASRCGEEVEVTAHIDDGPERRTAPGRHAVTESGRDELR